MSRTSFLREDAFTMLIMKYFFYVGVALTLGLFALSAHLESEGIGKGPRIITTTATIAVPEKPKEKVAEVNLFDEQLPSQDKTKGRQSHREGRRGH